MSVLDRITGRAARSARGWPATLAGLFESSERDRTRQGRPGSDVGDLSACSRYTVSVYESHARVLAARKKMDRCGTPLTVTHTQPCSLLNESCKIMRNAYI